MSKVDSLKKQYPELDISIMDIIVEMDKSKTNKYLPLLCKIFSNRYRKQIKNITERDKERIKEGIEDRGINVSNFTPPEQYAVYHILDIISNDNFNVFKEFQEYMERGLIENKDVLTYNTLEDMRGAISIAALKAQSKEMEKQAIKVFEDEEWLVVRPLTFEASAAYGSGTKWCTTQRTDKQYFARYWRRGILAYFINKINGTKYGLFKCLDEYDREVSWWNAEDNRLDFLEIDFNPKMYSVSKEILKSNQSNKDLCDVELQVKVLVECGELIQEEPTNEAIPRPVPTPPRELILTAADGDGITVTPGNTYLTAGDPIIERLSEEFRQAIDNHIVEAAIRTAREMPQANNGG